jgi:hypothetical protein
MYNLIENNINKLNINDIYNFAIKNNINLSNEEASFILKFIKNNWQEIFNNPNLDDLDKYKDNFNKDNFIKIKNLLIIYYNKYNKLLK